MLTVIFFARTIFLDRITATSHPGKAASFFSSILFNYFLINFIYIRFYFQEVSELQ
jgi:hypothetical protein